MAWVNDIASCLNRDFRGVFLSIFQAKEDLQCSFFSGVYACTFFIIQLFTKELHVFNALHGRKSVHSR